MFTGKISGLTTCTAYLIYKYVRIRPKKRYKEKGPMGQHTMYFVYPPSRQLHLHDRHGRGATREQKDLEVHVADRQNIGDREHPTDICSYAPTWLACEILSGWLNCCKNLFIPFFPSVIFLLYSSRELKPGILERNKKYSSNTRLFFFFGTPGPFIDVYIVGKTTKPNIILRRY